MKTRRLGPNGPHVSAIGLGAMGMSQSYGERNDEQSIRTVHRALDLGLNFIDTADVYGKGANEVLIGQALSTRRREAFLATKFGLISDAGASQGVNGRPEYVSQACNASLQRLQVGWIDLYYLHRMDPNVPIEDTVGAMSRLVEDGKVRFLGLSEVSAATLRRAIAVHPIHALQSEYSIWTRDIEESILSACRELGVSLVAFSPLGRGFLAGTVKDVEGLPADDARRSFPRFRDANLAANLKLLEPLEELAASKGCKPAQLALAWVLSRGDEVIPIPGTKRISYLEENIEALEIELTPAEVARIDEIAPVGAATGERYGAASMKLVDR
jgi:aryl-alcohol dehydrogenase-like predicted oxidoreductase